MFKYTILTLSVLLLCLIPGKSYPWFSNSDDTKLIGFTMKSCIPKLSSNHYILHYNSLNDCDDAAIFPDSGNNTTIFADRIDIDIPLSILSKEAIDPEESLDRILAANLRIQNILDEYLAFKKRTKLLLKNLRIPYLEEKDNKVKPKSAITGEVEKGETLKNDIKNIIKHGAGYDRRNYEQVERSVAIILQASQTGAGRKADQQQGTGDSINQMAVSEKYQKAQKINHGTQYDDELPWIFRFIFGILKYVYSNKLTIVLWLAILCISILITTLVLKR
ncbi:MAG: hypothetical protein GY857_12970 [Desulfobacula sp.]|nr:hypothetical protein [Desulfobacula sp.]